MEKTVTKKAKQIRCTFFSLIDSSASNCKNVEPKARFQTDQWTIEPNPFELGFFGICSRSFANLLGGKRRRSATTLDSSQEIGIGEYSAGSIGPIHDRCRQQQRSRS